MNNEVFNYIFVFYLVPTLVFSFIFSLFVWIILSNKYKKNYKDTFNKWEKQEIQKSLMEHKNKMELTGETDEIGYMALLIVKWESISDI